MPRTTVALRSRRGPVRGFLVRRFLSAISIAAGLALLGLAAFHRLDGVLAQWTAREIEGSASSELSESSLSGDAPAPPEVTVEGPDDGKAPPAPLVESDVASQAEPEVLPLVDTAALQDLVAAPAAAESVSLARVVRAPPPDGLTPLRVVIPRLGMNLAVFEGVSEKALRRGPGHLPGTPCPGLSSVEGNCVLTGHRDSFFRPLADARKGDLVELRSGRTSRRYRLVTRMVVRPDETQVAAPTSEERLTLVTCYPFRWIGSAPLRLAWQAEPEVARASRVATRNAVAP